MNRLSKAKFLALYPTCIFCGGRSPSTERDHQPFRHIFDDRIWPEEYEFPACSLCNDATQNDELIVDLFARFTSMKTADEWYDLRDRRIPHTLEWFPDLFWDMVPSAAQRRRDRKSLDPARRITLKLPEEFQYRVNRVAFKIAGALHWKHIKNWIIPPEGGCFVDIIPNLDKDAFLNTAVFRHMVSKKGSPVANRRSLNDQFEYEYWDTESPETGLYSVRLRRSFRLVLGVLGPQDFSAFKTVKPIEAKLISPFDPAEMAKPEFHQHCPPPGTYRWHCTQFTT